MARTLSVRKKDLRHNLNIFPSFHSSGSIRGMKKLFYGEDALLIRSGSYIYKVSREVYDFYSQSFSRAIF